MRILHLSDRLSERGGAYRHLLDVAAAQAEAGHELLLAAGRAEPGTLAPCPVRLVPGLEARTSAPVELSALARAFAPDIVHVHTVVNPEALRWAADRPALITVQDHRYFCPTRGKWTAAGNVCAEALSRDVCAGCFEDPDYFHEVYDLTQERLSALARLPALTLSHYMKRELATAGLDARQVAVVPPFASVPPPQPPDGPPCVAFVGRLTAAKGVAEAITAWRASEVALPLIFAGTGRLRSAIEAAGFEVLGWLDRARLGAFFARVRALLLPPRWQEPFGIVGLEALSLGIPVAAWRSGGIAEWHPGPLADWGDVAGLGRELADAIARGATVPAAGFEKKALMALLAEAYARVLSGTPLTTPEPNGPSSTRRSGP